MTLFRDTKPAAEFIASGDYRETSREIMQTIAYFARNLTEAEQLWADGPDNVICTMSDFLEHLTGNGLRQASDYNWGTSGNHWYDGTDNA